MAHSLDVLRTFLAVYRAGSVTGAAELLGLPRGMAPTAAADELARRIAGPLDALYAVAADSAAQPGPDDLHRAAAAVRAAGRATMRCSAPG